MPVELVIRRARLRHSPDLVDVAIDGGVVVGPAEPGAEGRVEVDAGGGLVLPAFTNPHQHLDKTLIGDALRPRRWVGWRGMREVNVAHRATYTVEDVLERASRVIEMALRNGTTAVRAFTDVEPVAGLTGTQALVRLREQYSGEVAIQVAAFPQDTLYGIPDGERLLEGAMDAGADVVSGLPSGEPTQELVHRHVDYCMDVAERHDADVHMLLDDSDDPAQRSLEYLALRTIATGWEGRVSVSHAGALSAYDHAHAEMVIERVADAGISVCVNPQISLVLQGRGDRGPIRRGTTRVGELLDAGVNVMAGQDDVDDPYYALGRADQLEVAQYAAHVCHLAWPDELETVIDMVTDNAARALRLPGRGPEIGAVADLVVCASPDVRSTLAELAPRRAVVSGGQLVFESTVATIRHGRRAP